MTFFKEVRKMLVLKRGVNESVTILVGGETIAVMPVSFSEGRVRLGFDAGPNVAIHRTEGAR